jgi:hypothetical protein
MELRMHGSLTRIAGAVCADVLVLACAGAALASQPTAGAKYKGQTAEKTPASLRVSGSGKNIPSYAFSFSYRCSNGTHGPTGFGSSKQTKPIPVAKNGTFALREKLRQPSVGQRITFTISGAFGGGGEDASGHFTERVRGSNGVSCQSGKVSFSVHRV